MNYRLGTKSPLFDAFVRGAFDGAPTAAPERAWAPPVDLIENEGAYLIQVELPGVSPDDVELTLVDRTLTLKGEKKLPDLDEGVSRHLHERRAASFERKFRFPVDVDASAVEATFEAGLLTVTVNKTPEAQPRRIEIQRR